MGPRSRPTDSRGLTFMVAGVFLQLLVLLWTFMMGLNWTGWDFNAAVGQAIAGLVLVVLVGRWRPALALVVPLISAVLTIGLVNAHIAHLNEGHNFRACTATEETVLHDLTPPEEVLTDLRGNNDSCSAMITTSRSADEVLAQYDMVFADHGWEKVPTELTLGTAAARDGWRVDVDATPGETVHITLSPR